MLSGLLALWSDQSPDVYEYRSNDGIFQLPSRDLNNLKNNRLGTLNFKLEISGDRKNWHTVSTQITDRKILDQLSEFARKI
jgi:hypothetical protein